MVNDAFIFPMKIFSPLPYDFQLEQDSPSSASFVLSVHCVLMKLSLLNPTKAQGKFVSTVYVSLYLNNVFIVQVFPESCSLFAKVSN